MKENRTIKYRKSEEGRTIISFRNRKNKLQHYGLRNMLYYRMNNINVVRERYFEIFLVKQNNIYTYSIS